MAPLFLFLALIVQSSLTLADVNNTTTQVTEDEAHKTINKLEVPVSQDALNNEPPKHWMDMFFLNGGNLYPMSSAAMMTQATGGNKTCEEQLEEIKEMASKITMAIQSELANLLSFALINSDKEIDGNGIKRKKRSLESPIDSAQLVMRLLNHIKNNNEYQNIAIEKMMSAQQIADKYGIDFKPDPEILSDMALAANNQAKELTSILKDACELKNVTKEEVQFIPLEEQKSKSQTENFEDNRYFEYAIHPHQETIMSPTPYAPYEYVPQQIHNQRSTEHYHPDHIHYGYYTPYETPVMHQHPPVSTNPTFYDMFAPAPEYFSPYCPIEPVTTTTTIVLPFEEIVEPEPELVGEEYEEVISSKVTVDRDEEPGSATVNHVMTYTLSEKAHFRTPQIERLPQQMQYTFFLM